MKRLILIAMVVLLASSIALAQDFCKGLADFDQDVDADDVTVFLSHFGRSRFFNPCPPDGPAPVGRTGQIGSYRTGDDGDLRKGVAWPNPRFTINGDGTVTDNLTGLIWLRDANCSLFNAPRTWYDALDIIVPQLADGYCGLTDGSSPGDWRLPNMFEMISLLDMEYDSPALSNTAGTGQWSEGDPFINIGYGAYFWTSNSWVYWSLEAFVVNTIEGPVDHRDKSNTCRIWPVRGGH